MTENAGLAPQIAYWHLWTDIDGISHQTRCALTEFDLKGVGGAAAQWNNRQRRSEASVVFTVQPVGWVGDWHENPAPQWIVVLSGRWWIESMDGTRVEQRPGEFSLGEDQGSTLADGRRGHRSGTIWFSDPHYGINTDYEGGKSRSVSRASLSALSDPRA